MTIVVSYICSRPQNLIVLIIIIMSSILKAFIAIDVYLWLESSHQANAAGRGTLYNFAHCHIYTLYVLVIVMVGKTNTRKVGLVSPTESIHIK